MSDYLLIERKATHILNRSVKLLPAEKIMHHQLETVLDSSWMLLDVSKSEVDNIRQRKIEATHRSVKEIPSGKMYQQKT